MSGIEAGSYAEAGPVASVPADHLAARLLGGFAALRARIADTLGAFNPVTDSLGWLDSNPLFSTGLSGDTRLFRNEVNGLGRFIHRPDSLLACGLLLEHFLERDETIVEIEFLQWDGVMDSQLTLVVDSKPISARPPKFAAGERRQAKGETQIAAAFVTSRGRRVYLCGVPNNREISEEPAAVIPPNPVAEAMVPFNGNFMYAYDLSTGTHKFVFMPLRPELQAQFISEARPGFVMAAFADIVTRALTLLDSNMGMICNTYDTVRGFRNVQLPTPEQLISCSVVAIRVINDEVQPSARYRNIDLEIAFLTPGGEKVGGGICAIRVPSQQTARSTISVSPHAAMN